MIKYRGTIIFLDNLRYRLFFVAQYKTEGVSYCINELEIR